MGEIKLVFMGAFLSYDDADRFREVTLSGLSERIRTGEIVLVENDIRNINTHYVVRIMAENAQKELPLE